MTYFSLTLDSNIEEVLPRQNCHGPINPSGPLAGIEA
jgi:hypothetical protein